MGGNTILSFLGWAVLLMTYDLVSGRRPPCQLPLFGGLTVSVISVMVGPGANWPLFCHGAPRWILCPPSPLIDRRLLVLHDVPPVDTMSYHGGVLMSCTGGIGIVTQYRAIHATKFPVALAVSPR